MMLVTLQQASDHLRRDTSDDDNDLTLKIHAASAAVLNYLDEGAESFLDSAGDVLVDSNGDPTGVPFEVQAATLLLIGEFYKNRGGMQEGEIDQKWGYGYLPRSVVALLYPLRDPALR